MRLESFVDIFNANGDGCIDDEELEDLLDRMEGKKQAAGKERLHEDENERGTAEGAEPKLASESESHQELDIIPDSEEEEDKQEKEQERQQEQEQKQEQDQDVIPDSQEEEARAADGDEKQDAHAPAEPSSPPFSCTMLVTSDLDTAFPPMKNERFSPSPFQVALLQHVEQVRGHLSHQVGLLVMATALGKTIFCILDIERQLKRREAEQGEGGEQDEDVRFQQGHEEAHQDGLRADEEGAFEERGSDAVLPWRVVTEVDREIPVKQEHLELILPLGFPEVSCRRALQVRDHDPHAAIDWLLSLQEGKVWEELKDNREGEQRGKRRAGGHFLPDTRGGMKLTCSKRSKSEGGSRLIDLKGRRAMPLCKHFTFLFLVHTRAIRDAAYEKFQRHFVSLGYDRASFLNVSEHLGKGQLPEETFNHVLFIFCLFQSFDRLPSSIVARVTHVCFDECHHLLAESYLKIFETIRQSSNLTYCLGMTATLRHRSDPQGEDLKKLFKGVLYIDFSWISAKSLGFFPSVEYLEALPTLHNGADAKTYAQLHDMFVQHGNVRRFVRDMETSLTLMGMGSTEQCRRSLTPDNIVRTIFAYQTAREAACLSPKRRMLIFVQSTFDADEVSRLLNRSESHDAGGLRHLAMSAHYKQGGRAERNVAKFASRPAAGMAHALVTISMLNEGYDCPGVDFVVLARVTDSEIVFAQQMGRGLRRDTSDPSKEVTILDLALNLRRRWKRLMGELPDSIVHEMIKSFWHVTNFVGHTTKL